jgi:hypothetical protein
VTPLFFKRFWNRFAPYDGRVLADRMIAHEGSRASAGATPAFPGRSEAGNISTF